MAEERQCMCTTPEITIKLNKQGPQGKIGPQGEPGFSPYIGVANDTPSQYILRITNEDGEYLTPNLKANIPLGGSTGDVLTKNSDVNGDCSFKALPYASTTQQGVVYLATTEEALLGDTDYAITGEVLLGVLANKIGNGTITLTQGGVTKGTFTTNQAGDTSIALDGAPANMVTTNTTQSISGNKIFRNKIAIDMGVTNSSDSNGRTWLYNNNVQTVLGNYHWTTTVSGSQLDLKTLASDITITRAGGTFTNVDSGNISGYIGNGTITFTQGGVTKGTITTNQSGDATIALDEAGSSLTAGTAIDITNDAISVKYDSAKGLAVTNNSLGIRVDGTTVDFDASGNLKSLVQAPSYSAGTGIDITSNVISVDFTDVATASQGAKADTAVQPSDLATVATTGDYTDLINKPTIPDISNMVTTDTTQTITGLKDFSSGLIVSDIRAGSNLTIRRSDGQYVNLYTNIDSGNIGSYALTSSNISTDTYIQALVARITALETNINGGNANA